MMVQQRESSSSGNMERLNQHDHHVDASGKTVRYTGEQVEALERVYAECPKPSSSRIHHLLREFPVLSNMDPKQIKIWFQNRRCREKQRKEASRLQAVNRKLTAMNKILMEENIRLHKQVSLLISENGFVKQELDTSDASGARATDISGISAVTSPHQSVRDANSPAGLLFIAEEALAEFLSKAAGTAVKWVQVPGMKPGLDSVGIFAISGTGSGMAARACGYVGLEPTQIAEILKDRPSWFRDCRSIETFTMFPAGNGGTIELIYSQTYALTTLGPALDFWTLRYTTTLENGTLVVCETSLSGSGAGPNAAAASQFMRAEMLPSGYLILPCEGGSIIHIVDHLNFEAWAVPEVLQPLYESSKIVAQRMTVAALRYVRQIAQELSGEVVYHLGRQPAVLRTFSQKLSRGFNDAINGFIDDGWSILDFDGAEDVILAVNSTKILTRNFNPSGSILFVGEILCAKASILLQNVPSAELVCFLREHRSAWSDFTVDAYSAVYLEAGSHANPGIRDTKFTGNQFITPLGHTIELEEMLEVIRLEGHSLAEDALASREIHLIQMCRGIDENAVGGCSEFVFSPIGKTFADDAPLLPSGFRVIPLESKTDVVARNRTMDLTSRLDVGSAMNSVGGDGSSNNARSVLTIAFQFPFESSLQEHVATMARQYLRSVIASVQRVAMAISPSGFTPSVRAEPSIGSTEALTLAHWICESYSLYMGTELLRSDSVDDPLKQLWAYQNAILCCSLKSVPVFIFANQAGLDMLETTLVGLQDVPLDKIFDELGHKALFGDIDKLMEQGSSYLPGGLCKSTMGRCVSYEQVIAWKVLAGQVNTVHCLAFSFQNWSFLLCKRMS